MKKITIAIDGHSSCGKSTIAKGLARKLNLLYIDSGAMYRAVTLHCLRKGLIRAGKFSSADVINELSNIYLSFHIDSENNGPVILLNGENVEREIRQMPVSNCVSAISAITEVREKMVDTQRSLARNKSVVMDGRDIGTNVFPDAELKLFVTADTDIRAQRRFDELKKQGASISLDEVRKNIEQRDYEDTHRLVHPLRQASDAIVIDNSYLTVEDQLDRVLKLAKAKMAETA